MNSLLLRLLPVLTPLWKSMGVNPGHLRAILEIKLLADGRRRSAFNHYQQQSKKGKKPSSGQDLLAMFMYLLMGGLFLLLFAVIPNKATGLLIFFSGWMFMLALTLIADFTDVLIDVRDNYILLPRPVNDQTLAVSRLLHVIFYLIKLILAFFLPGMVFITVKFGLSGLLVFLLLAAISTLLALFLVNLTYLVLLQITSPRQFKDIINYFQMVFSALMLFGFQVVPRIVPMDGLEQLNLLEHPFWRLTPPAWLAALWEWWIGGNTDQTVVLLGSLGLAAPVVALWASAKVFTRDFNQKLLAIGEGSSGTVRVREASRKSSQKQSWMARTGGWWRLNQLERATYELTWKISQHSRDFKLKFYPSLVFAPMMVIILAIPNSAAGAADKLNNLSATPSLLGFLYVCLLVLFSGIQNVSYSERHRAAWMFVAPPVAQPGMLISGALKAVLTKFYIPYFLACSVLLVSYAGPGWIADCLLAFFANIVIALTTILVFNQPLPFSQPWENQSKGTGVGGFFLLFFIAGFAGFLHYLARPYPAAIWALAVLAAALSYYLLKTFQTLSWKSILAERG